jgi:HK97 gp10 family phage protein
VSQSFTLRGGEILRIRDNLPDFKKQLQRVSNEMQSVAVRASNRKAAQVIARSLRAVAGGRLSPKANPESRTGNLVRAIYVFRNGRASTRGAERFLVGVRTGRRSITNKKTGKKVALPDAFYARFLERGWIPRGPGQKITGGNRTRAVKREQLVASGKALRISYPFMQTSFRASQNGAINAFVREMTRQVAKLDKLK